MDPEASQPRPRTFALPDRGGEMAALDFGDPARPVDVIFSHANGFNAGAYRSILGPLSADLRVLAIDMRGHGATRLPTVTEGRRDWDDYRDDLVSLLEVVATQPVILAGHSMGGAVSLLAAAQVPDKVRGLVMFDPVLDPDRSIRVDGPTAAKNALRRRALYPSSQAVMDSYRGRGAFVTWTEQQLADYVAAGFHPTADGQVTLACTPQWEASNFLSLAPNPWAAFKHTRGPVRILLAEHDSSVGLKGPEEEMAALGRVRIELIPGSSHFLPMEQPELVRAALREAVAG